MSMADAMNEVLDKVNRDVPKPENEYIGKNGLLHCSICHKSVETEIEILGVKKRVRCICSCKKKEIEAYAVKEQQQDLDRKRKICFAETNMKAWNFRNDDRKNPKISDAMQNYVKNFLEFKKDGKGLLLYGFVGTGKTYFAACIANSLIDNGYMVMMTNFARLTNQLQGLFEGKQKFIDSLNRYSLLIIDDLGAERKSEFMQEQVFNIIDSRYRAGLPFIITTNLTAEEIKKPQDVGNCRIYDRILERCVPVEVSGGSRRRESLKNTYSSVKEKLGI